MNTDPNIPWASPSEMDYYLMSRQREHLKAEIARKMINCKSRSQLMGVIVKSLNAFPWDREMEGTGLETMKKILAYRKANNIKTIQK